jgi:DNA invertase Pin-like site-specific DNA recombinase
LQKQGILRGFLRNPSIKMKIGYARVSTLEQNLDLQLRALEKAGCKKIFREKVSGSNRERQSLSEPWASDTTTHAGKMIMTIFAGIAEFERDLIRERTGAGREAARKRGVRFGRPRKLSVDQEQLAQRLVLEGKSVSDIARTFNVHVATIYRLSQMQ